MLLAHVGPLVPGNIGLVAEPHKKKWDTETRPCLGLPPQPVGHMWVRSCGATASSGRTASGELSKRTASRPCGSVRAGNVALVGEPHKKINSSGSSRHVPQHHLGVPPGFTATGIAGLGNCLVARALSPPPPPPLPSNQCWTFGDCMGGWVSRRCRSCVVLAVR